MAPLVRELRSHPNDFEVTVCVTGQHRQMLDQVMQVLEIDADIDLDLMKHNQDLCDVTSAVMTAIRDTFSVIRPDIVLIHGDTTTALSTSMACFYLGIPIGHVEAGLRSHDLTAPFPEEFNRQVVSKISTLHFAPTEKNRANLLAEGINPSHIFVTGNTIIDSLKHSMESVSSNKLLSEEIQRNLQETLGFDIRLNEYVLITGHRRENFGTGLENICHAILELANNFPATKFVYPVHLNPNVQKPVRELLGSAANIYLIEPSDYLTFLSLMANCKLILTDSGGIQEEAPSFGKPVVLMRDTTERSEAIESGTAIMVGSDPAKIVEAISNLLQNIEQYEAMSSKSNPFGDGLTSKRIAEILREY